MKGARSSIATEGHHESLKNESQNLWIRAWLGAKDNLFRLLSSSSKTQGMFVLTGNVVSGISTNIYMFKVNNRHTRKKCKVSSKLTIKDSERRHLTSFWCLYCWLWTYLASFSSFSIVEFKQVNVCWVGKYLYKVNNKGIWTVPIGIVLTTLLLT